MALSPGKELVVESLKKTSKGRLSYNSEYHPLKEEQPENEQRSIIPLPLSSPPKSVSNRLKATSPKLQGQDIVKEEAEGERKQAMQSEKVSASNESNTRIKTDYLQASSLNVVGLLMSHATKVEEQVKAEAKQRKDRFLAGMQQLKIQAHQSHINNDSKNEVKYQNDVKIVEELQHRSENFMDSSHMNLMHAKRKQIASKNEEKIRMLREEIIAKQKQQEEEKQKNLNLSRKIESLALSARAICKGIITEIAANAQNKYLAEILNHLHVELTKQYAHAMEVAKNALHNQDGLEGAYGHLESTIENFNKINEKLKEKISEANTKESEDAKKVEELKAAEEKRIEDEQKQAQARNQNNLISNQAKLTISQDKPASNQEYLSCVSPDAFKFYNEVLRFRQDFSNTYAELTSTNGNADIVKEKKSYRFRLSKVINTPINAISDQSATHLIDKISRLTHLLKGQAVQSSDKPISANDHPNGLAYCKDTVAKKLVRQGAHQISSSFNSAFSFAAVALGIWAELPDVGPLILAHFYISCPYLVPFYIPKKPDQSIEEYHQVLGYDVNGKDVESEDKYLKKLSGMIRLYAAIVQSPMPTHLSAIPHPHGIHNGWTWLTRLLNLEPRKSVTATILFDFLEVAGFCLSKTYKKQFQKLLQVLLRDIMPKIDAVTPADQKGPVVRLKSFLEKCIKSGMIPLPEGNLSSKWWKSS